MSKEPKWLATRSRLDYRPYESGASDAEPLQEIEEAATPLDWTPTIVTLLLGAQDANSPLSLLRGKEETIIQDIIKMLMYKYQEGAVTITPPAHSVASVWHWLVENAQDYEDPEYDYPYDGPPLGIQQVTQVLAESVPWSGSVFLNSEQKANPPQIAFSPCGMVEFPEPTGININMMPFVMGDRSSLPQELWPYFDMILSKCPVDESEMGQVMYLSVQESFVKASDTQRRAGLHVEAPAASFRHTNSGTFVAGEEAFRWGSGSAKSPDELHGGLYLASNVSNTTAVWDALVNDVKLGGVDFHGGMEHLRPFIGKGKKLPAGLLVWMTDRTPHEALPQEQDGYRQFIRLVTADISVWFAAHSTPNPKVPVPAHVKIIGESKFKEDPNKGGASFTGGRKRKNADE